MGEKTIIAEKEEPRPKTEVEKFHDIVEFLDTNIKPKSFCSAVNNDRNGAKLTLFFNNVFQKRVALAYLNHLDMYYIRIQAGEKTITIILL